MQIYEIFLTDFCIIVHEVWVGHIMTSVLHAGFFFSKRTSTLVCFVNSLRLWGPGPGGAWFLVPSGSRSANSKKAVVSHATLRGSVLYDLLEVSSSVSDVFIRFLEGLWNILSQKRPDYLFASDFYLISSKSLG